MINYVVQSFKSIRHRIKHGKDIMADALKEETNTVQAEKGERGGKASGRRKGLIYVH